MPETPTSRRRFSSTRLAGLLTFAVVVAPAAFSGAREADRSSTSLACVEAWGESRYRNYGYDHIVHVRNRCEKAVLCAVSTNVNPDPQKVTVQPAEVREVLTFRGSPAHDFVPKVDCKLLM